MRDRGFAARAIGGALLLVAAAGAVAAIALALGFGDREPLELRAARIARVANAKTSPDADPFAWSNDRRAQFEAGAATAASHVIYEMSPDGVVASAKRTEAFRDQIAVAAERHDLDPDTLEALIFLESAGRPDVIAGPTPESASGLGQILPSTATDLLGMSVDLPRSIQLTRRISNSDSAGETERLQQQRAGIDERFDPKAAIEGAATYLEIARKRFGDDQLAIASYHMGIGNLESVLRAYAHASDDAPIGELVSSHHLSYPEVFFSAGPDAHRKAYELLSGFGDESSQYLWKVLASEQMLHTYRDNPDQLAETATLATNKSSMEEVFHPENETEVFETPDDISDALDDGDLVPLPDEPVLGWEPNKDIGELAGRLDQSPSLYRALRPEALATLTYLAGLVREQSGAATPLQLDSAVRDRTYQDLLVQSNIQATPEYSLHTTGWAFDIRREYESKKQARSFQYQLDRLRSIGLLDYAVEPGAIHVTVSDLGAELLKQ